MQNENQNLDGLHLVAMKDGLQVENQAEAVTALLKPLIASVRKFVEPDPAAQGSIAGQSAVADRERYILDLEIECATLRHGLRLADRRYEDLAAIANRSPQIPENGQA